MDERLAEDGPGLDRLRVGQPGIPGQGAQQLHGPDPALGHDMPGSGEVGREAAVEAHLERHAGGMGGVDGAVRVGEGQGHRLLAEHGLAGG